MKIKRSHKTNDQVRESKAFQLGKLQAWIRKVRANIRTKRINGESNSLINEIELQE